MITCSLTHCGLVTPYDIFANIGSGKEGFDDCNRAYRRWIAFRVISLALWQLHSVDFNDFSSYHKKIQIIFAIIHNALAENTNDEVITK